MKKIIYISLFLLSPLVIFGQEKTPDIRKEQGDKSKLQTEVQKDRQANLKVSDSENSINPDSTNADNPRGRMQKMRKRMMDSFMDKDGDGINDCRAKGMKWSGKGSGAGKGKHMGFGRHGK